MNAVLEPRSISQDLRNLTVLRGEIDAGNPAARARCNKTRWAAQSAADVYDLVRGLDLGEAGQFDGRFAAANVKLIKFEQILGCEVGERFPSLRQRVVDPGQQLSGFAAEPVTLDSRVVGIRIRMSRHEALDSLAVQPGFCGAVASQSAVTNLKVAVRRTRSGADVGIMLTTSPLVVADMHVTTACSNPLLVTHAPARLYVTVRFVFCN